MGYIVEAVGSTPRARVVDSKGAGLLTAREEQVVNLVADGAGNRAFAQQLGIKENTVKKSLMRIYDKVGVSNRVELVLYALTHRGIDVIAPGMPEAPEALAMDRVTTKINPFALSLKAN